MHFQTLVYTKIIQRANKQAEEGGPGSVGCRWGLEGDPERGGFVAGRGQGGGLVPRLRAGERRWGSLAEFYSTLRYTWGEEVRYLVSLCIYFLVQLSVSPVCNLVFRQI